MKKSGYAVDVVGATGLVGRELLVALEERGFPLSQLRAFASLGSIGEVLNCGTLNVMVSALDAQTRFEQTDVVFLVASEQVSAETAERASAAGAVVIDASGLYAEDTSVPLVVPEINPADVAGFGGRRVIANPDTVAIALAVVLAPLHALAPVRSVVATSFEPVSGAGRAGVAELERQTRDLMGGRDTELDIFPQRIAFNAIPQVGEFLAGGAARGEHLARVAVRRLLGNAHLPVHITRVRIPTFYGTSLSVSLDLAKPLGEDVVRTQLRQAPGLLVLDDLAERLYPTPAASVGNDATFVGRIRQEPGSTGVDLWIAIDNTRKGCAVNAVQIAEILVRDHL